MTDNETRYEEELKKILNIVSYKGITYVDKLIEIENSIKALLNPPQEFEEVEVFIRAGSEPNTIWFVDPKDGYTKQLDRSTDVTIKFQRPKPQKVKRREEIYYGDNRLSELYHKGVKFYAEWEEDGV